MGTLSRTDEASFCHVNFDKSEACLEDSTRHTLRGFHAAVVFLTLSPTPTPSTAQL